MIFIYSRRSKKRKEVTCCKKYYHNSDNDGVCLPVKKSAGKKSKNCDLDLEPNDLHVLLIRHPFASAKHDQPHHQYTAICDPYKAINII